LQHGVPAILCQVGGLVSFAHPELGPASDEVVRLVKPSLYVEILTTLATRPRRSQLDVVLGCREYYERHFSDVVVLQRWLNVCNGKS